MLLQEFFTKSNYSNIIKKKDAVSYGLSVEMLYDEDEKIPKELKCLYISKTCDELFFILDGREYDLTELCEKWDRKISAFMTFGSKDKEILRKLKYNAIQIILYDSPIVDRSEEGSLNVTRKILLPCIFSGNGMIEIQDDEAVGIPFYLIPTGDFKVNEELVSQLNDCLPEDERGEFEFLSLERKLVQKRVDDNNILKKNFIKEEYDKIKEWLNTNVDTISYDTEF